MNKLIQSAKQFMSNEEGVTAIEYGLLASLIALAIIAGATALGGKLDDMFTFISTQLKTSA
ncbi:Flp family type IVb pilin [Nitrosomonas sp. Nm58]|uniref:Flp family type IVb pilin n=1 Tax=Nitrosomonas sp. Nm58 TaxID=200126 RepID=UPI00089A6CC3|nr:Flp family type IVb pilin [Nitrosomonas sp. Nm58]SDY66963.1 pilus assembly protein Flp/PilA [Nitrosomonas sp. Nm58]